MQRGDDHSTEELWLPCVLCREGDAGSAAPPMSLDAFMAEHTSEDNASFSEILEGINKRKRERYKWLHGQIEEKVQALPFPFLNQLQF